MTQTLTFQIPRQLNAKHDDQISPSSPKAILTRSLAVCVGPGQLVHADMKSAGGRPLEGVVLADIHDLYKSNFKPEHIGRDDSNVRLDRAFTLDFDVNGPRHATGDGFFQTAVCDWSVDMTIM